MGIFRSYFLSATVLILYLHLMQVALDIQCYIFDPALFLSLPSDHPSADNLVLCTPRVHHSPASPSIIGSTSNFNTLSFLLRGSGAVINQYGISKYPEYQGHSAKN